MCSYPEGRSSLRSPGILVLLIVGGAALSAAACNQSARGQSDAGTTPAPDVQVAPVREARLDRTINISGALAAEEQAVLSMKTSGRLSGLHADLGSAVNTGQPLATLEPTDFKLRVAQADAALRQARARLGLSPEDGDDRLDPEKTAIVRQAKAVLEEAELTLNRARTFVARGLSSRAELDSAEAAFKVADGRHQDALEEVRNRQAIVAQRRSELELAREQLTATVLRAPFEGRILDRAAALGQYVAAGTPIMTLVRVDPLRLRVDVPEREAPHVKRDQRVRVSVEGDSAVYSGRIARLSPAISADNRTLLVEAEIGNRDGRLRPGAFVRAEIVVEAGTAALLIPATSVVSFAGVDKVFTVEKGLAVERRVQIGRAHQDSVELVKGLNAGESVIVRPGSLTAGTVVRVVGR